MNKDKIEIKFKDLSFALKFIIIFGWVNFGFYLIAFIVGFIQGVSGY